ncbi:MAG: hypothetical protein K9G36_08730 [Crocinitomicaceae bacterium]|jgi:predicted  nucleic acid-binding Zn-ribbon protein|nr:hypothetical protein [Crocinitomicaceae bacterium]MCF8411628.1 hypothetical protein [Crocinitomicaceae bacterium]MCF8444148.1 hypothetical protein [Crocinitomicaceae bacterium]
MTERIQNSIDSIKAKIATLMQGLIELKTQNAAMSSEIQSLKDELHEKAQNALQMQTTIENLNHELDLAKKQVIDLSQKPVGRSEEEIDELVKEIDYCIEQLKK